MNKSVQRSIFAILIFAVMAGGTYAYQDPIEIGSAVLAGVGGRHVAQTEDFSTYLNNPAGLQSIEEETSFSEVTLHLKGPVFSLADVFLTGDTSSLSDMVSNGLYSGAELLGPLSFGYVGDGIGFGIYNNSDILINSASALTVDATVREEIVLTGGYAFPLIENGEGHRLDMGIMLKGGFRGGINGTLSVVELMNLDYTALLGEPFDFTSFIGADIGLLYSHERRFYAGLVARDAFTPTHTNTYANVDDFIAGATPTNENQFDLVPFTLDLGMRYTFDFTDRNLFITKVDTFFDYRDLFDFWLHPQLAVNPVLHVQMGLEATMLQILDVRAGLREGLPSAGIGLDLHHFTLNAAMFGTERTTEPGLNPVYNIQFGLEFRN